MKTAKDLMLAYLAGNAEQSGALFAEQGTLELPYLASIGIPPVNKGPEETTKFLTFLHGTLYPDFKFENIKVHLETPDQVFAEYFINHDRASMANRCTSSFLVISKPRTARSSACARRSTSSLQRRRSIRMGLPTSSPRKPDTHLLSETRGGMAMSVFLDQAEAILKTAKAKAAEIGVAASILYWMRPAILKPLRAWSTPGSVRLTSR